jgi:hypothetical protein
MAKSNYLTPLESLIYNRIKFFTEQGEYKYCSQSNGTLSKYFNRPKESISRTIAKLKKLGYITEEKDGTLRKLFSTNKENIYNYAVNTNDEVVNTNDEVVNTNDEVVNTNDEVVNIDDKVVILKSLLNDEVVIKAMTKSLTSDDEVVKHNIKILSIELNKDLNKDEKENFENEFNEFWELYTPIRDSKGDWVAKGSKKECKKKFIKIMLEGVSYGTVINSLKQYLEYCKAANRQSCGAEVFINQRRWENDYSCGQTVDANKGTGGERQQPSSYLEIAARAKERFKNRGKDDIY